MKSIFYTESRILCKETQLIKTLNRTIITAKQNILHFYQCRTELVNLFGHAILMATVEDKIAQKRNLEDNLQTFKLTSVKPWQNSRIHLESSLSLVISFEQPKRNPAGYWKLANFVHPCSWHRSFPQMSTNCCIHEQLEDIHLKAFHHLCLSMKYHLDIDPGNKNNYKN